MRFTSIRNTITGGGCQAEVQIDSNEHNNCRTVRDTVTACKSSVLGGGALASWVYLPNIGSR